MKVAALRLGKLGVKLPRLPRKADYFGVPVERPFKPDHHRYQAKASPSGVRVLPQAARAV